MSIIGLETPYLALSRYRAARFKSNPKRVIDLVGGGAAIICLLPLFLVVALLIKLGSRGPIFYRQTRHGLLGSTFEILKFRTMFADECAFAQCQKDDPRITRIGKFLRKTSIDELPQLINVLLGDMSLVGPRPHAVVHDHQLAVLTPRIMERYAVKPGLTGLAQIKGLRGPTASKRAVEDRLSADLHYVEKNSVWLDLKIMFLTVPVVLSAVNAL